MVYGIWTFVAALVAFIISAVAGAFLIPMLRTLHFGQTILEDGPKWHKKKQGTPITLDDFAYVFDATRHSGKRVEGGLQFVGDDLGQGCLADARRSP